MLQEVIDWTNANSGFVGVLIFLLTLILGWVTGIIQALRHRPRFKLKKLEGPNLCAISFTGREFRGYPTHRTAIAVYLEICNVGTAPSAIKEVNLGVRFNIRPFRWLWVKHRICWSWLSKPTVSLSDFFIEIGDHAKVYPFLLQGTASTMQTVDTYMEVGKMVNGVVYFEQDEAWGGFMPVIKDEAIKVKVRVRDVFGGSHSRVFNVPVVELADAQRYCPTFGTTYEILRTMDDLAVG